MAYKKVVIKVSAKLEGKRCAKVYNVMDDYLGTHISFEGANQDLIVICGHGIDAAEITMKLRKKFDRSCLIESVATIEPPKKKEEKKEDATKPFDIPAQCFAQPNFIPRPIYSAPNYNQPPPPPPPPPPSYLYPEPEPHDPCSIM